MRLFVATVLLAICVAIPSSAAGPFQNGGFESWSGQIVADYWTGYAQGTNWAFMQYFGPHSGDYAQKVTRTTNNTANKGGVWQEVTANIGDAFTLADAWINCASDSSLAKISIRADWDGGPGNITAIGTAAIMATATQPANTWYEFTGAPSGNALGGSVTFYLDARMASAASAALDTVWDDVSILQAFVPAAPGVGGATASSLTLDVNPGGNLSNAAAQFAVTIGGGAFALGSNWLQADGSVGSTPVWQTDAAWGSLTVGGLAASTPYSFKVKGRYDSTYTQETYLGAATELSTVPEPGSLAILLSGLSAIGFAVRRRKS